MAQYEITVDGTDICEEYGATILGFTEELPEPKVIKVPIPAGVDLDITESIGPVAYHNGKHSLVLLVEGEDEPERMMRVRKLVALLHGQMHDYELSWDEGYLHRGRFWLKVERVVPDASRVTLDVDYTPWKWRTETVDMVAHPTETHRLEGSTRYANVRVKFLQTGSASVGTHTGSYDEAGTYLLAESVDGDADVTVTVLWWLMYLDEEAENMVVRAAYFDMDGNDAQIDGTYTVSAGGNMVFSDEALQRVTLTYERVDL